MNKSNLSEATTWRVQLLLAALFSGLLSIAFLDHSRFYFAWVAYIPILFAIERASYWRTYVLGVVAGGISFASGTYWIFDFIIISKGTSTAWGILLSSIVWLYCAQQTALVFLLFKWLRARSGLHEFILFPLLVASFTSAFPMLFAMRLGESQINFYSALQAIEFTGVHGLDAIIALSNIVLFRVLYVVLSRNDRSPPKLGLAIALSTSTIAIWFGYGIVSFSNWEERQRSWQTTRIGIVQPNEIPWLGGNISYPGFSQAYPPEMAMTERLVTQGARLVVWPEAQAKGYLNNSKIFVAYHSNIARLKTSLLFQDTEQIINSSNGERLKQFNTAIMLNESGQETGQYQKLKRIPFGEYLPVISNNQFLHNKAKRYLGDFLNEMSKGQGYRVFNHKDFNVVPLICYETTFPSFVGGAVKASAGKIDNSKGSILIALSNDGWFGSTHQPYQHIMVSVLRAVENRLPLVHVANNGPSIAVSPSGRITFTSDFQHAGGYIAEVSHSKESQGSFYSRHPQLFDRLLYIVLALSILLAAKRSVNSRWIKH